MAISIWGSITFNNHYINGFFNDIEVLGSNPLDIIGLLDPVDRLTSLDPWPVAIPFVCASIPWFTNLQLPAWCDSFFTHGVSLAKPQTVSQDSEWTEWTEWTECGVGSSFPLCATCSSVAQQSRLSQLLRRKLAVIPTRWRKHRAKHGLVHGTYIEKD